MTDQLHIIPYCNRWLMRKVWFNIVHTCMYVASWGCTALALPKHSSALQGITL